MIADFAGLQILFQLLVATDLYGCYISFIIANTQAEAACLLLIIT